MRLLLDTQVWLWLQVTPEKLVPEVLDRLTDRRSELLLSAASTWEIAINHSLGKLPLPEHPRDYVPSRMRADGVADLPITQAHAMRVVDLPPHHRDPFDRLLVAQAQVERLTLVTADALLSQYDVTVLPATALA